MELIRVLLPLISIIIPVYNVEKYLNRCLNSILAQTFKEYEVLLIDDGSNDSSAFICDEYVNRDYRFKVIHKENKGVSNARNVGIENSIGKYIVFIDSDDWIAPDYLNVLYTTMQEANCDLAYCSFKRVKEFNPSIKNTENALNSKEKIAYSIYDDNFWFGSRRGVLWAAIYYREKVGELRFDETISIGEDKLFLLEYAKKCKNIIYVPYKLYNYFQREDSAMHNNVFKESDLSILNAQKLIFQLFSDNKKTLLYAKASYCGKCWAIISRYYNDHNFRKKYYKSLIKLFRKHLGAYLQIGCIPLIKKLKFICYALIPKLYFLVC